MRKLAILGMVMAGLPQIPGDYLALGGDPDVMTTSTKDAPDTSDFPMEPDPTQANRHERRKAAKLNPKQ